MKLFNPKKWQNNPNLNKFSINQFHHLPKIGAWIAKDFKHGRNFKIGLNCIIEPRVKVGNNATIGNNCLINTDVKAKNDLFLGDCVILASGTRLANNVNIERGCVTTGICYMGNNSQLRACTTLSKGWVIEDDVFIGAGVMTSHTLRPWVRRAMKHTQHFSFVGKGCWLGSMGQYAADIRIAPGVIVGYHANVVKDLDQPNGVYLNRPYPWATLQKVLKKGDKLYYPIPKNYKQSFSITRYFTMKEVKKYLPKFTKSRSK